MATACGTAEPPNQTQSAPPTKPFAPQSMSAIALMREISFAQTKYGGGAGKELSRQRCILLIYPWLTLSVTWWGLSESRMVGWAGLIVDFRRKVLSCSRLRYREKKLASLLIVVCLEESMLVSIAMSRSSSYWCKAFCACMSSGDNDGWSIVTKSSASGISSWSDVSDEYSWLAYCWIWRLCRDVDVEVRRAMPSVIREHC